MFEKLDKNYKLFQQVFLYTLILKMYETFKIVICEA
jgi:hypothetical protein